MKLKNKITIILLFFVIPYVSAQKIEIGANTGLNNYKDVKKINKQNYDYIDNINSSGSNGELFISYFPKETYYISLGVKVNDFQKNVLYNNASVKTFERMLKFPVKLNFREQLSDMVFWDIGLGPYVGVLKNQRQVLPDNSFTTYGFASYSNLGLTASSYLLFIPKEKAGFKIGFNTDYDVTNISSKNDDVIVNSFAVFSMEFGIFLKF